MRYYPSVDEEGSIAAKWHVTALGLKSFTMTATIDPCAEDDQSVVVSLTMLIPPEVEEWLDRNLQGRWCLLAGTSSTYNRIWCELQEDSVLVTLSRD